MPMTNSFDLMEQTLRRAFTDDVVAKLFGSGPERALAAYRNLYVEEAITCVAIECPLLGAPCYDMFVGPFRDLRTAGAHLPKEAPPACHAAFDWVTTLGRGDEVDVFFELDTSRPEGQHPAIQCRHKSDIDVATDFFKVIGEDWRTPFYRDVMNRLPGGWQTVYAGVFTGRPGSPTRLELVLTDDERLRCAEDPAHLGSCFDRIGFSAYDSRMLEDIARLAGASLASSLQFDIFEGGALGRTFSITSSFEKTGTNFSALFQDDGAVGSIFRLYERMGIADGRWRLAEQALFATKQLAWADGRLRQDVTISRPSCGKAKWVDAVLQPAKVYFMEGAITG